LLDVIRFILEISATQEILLAEEKENDITTIISSLDVPFYVVMGKYDYMTSTNSAKAFYDNVKAPIKDFIIFEKSAHYPQFEEENVFADWLLQTWESLDNY